MAKILDVRETFIAPVCLGRSLMPPSAEHRFGLRAQGEYPLLLRSLLFPRHTAAMLSTRVQLSRWLLADWAPASLFSDALCESCQDDKAPSRTVQAMVKPGELLEVLVRNHSAQQVVAEPTVLVRGVRQVGLPSGKVAGQSSWSVIDCENPTQTYTPVHCARCAAELVTPPPVSESYAQGYRDGVLAMMPAAEREARLREARALLGEDGP